MWCVLGGVLLSRTLAGAVPSALSGLASGFGMGPGVSLSLCPPRRLHGQCVSPSSLVRLYSVIRVTAPCNAHCVWLVVGLGVDRIVDALRMLTRAHPPAFGFHLVVLGVLLFVLAY